MGAQDKKGKLATVKCRKHKKRDVGVILRWLQIFTFYSINLKLKIMLYKFDKRRMDYVLAKDYFVKIVVGIIASWLVVFGLTSYNQSTKLNSIKYITEETRLLILNNENKFSEEKLKEAILALNY